MLNFIKNNAARYQALTNVPKSFVLVSVTYMALTILFFLTRFIIGNKAAEAMEPYNNSNTLINKNINTADVPVLGNIAYTNIFKLQNDVIVLRRQHHYYVAMSFLKNYYAVITCLIFISCVGGMLLFVLINQGWAASSFTAKAFFLSLAAAAVLFSLFSTVFSQQRNFEDNLVRYMNYTKAEFSLAKQLTSLSKKDYPSKYVAKKDLDPAYKAAASPTKKDSVAIKDTISYFRHLDTLVARNHEILNTYTDYILTTDASKMRNIGEVYQSLLELKQMGNLDTTRRRQ
jgi:hypothetical protein